MERRRSQKLIVVVKLMGSEKSSQKWPQSAARECERKDNFGFLETPLVKCSFAVCLRIDHQVKQWLKD